MNREEINMRLAEIRAVKDDFEAAHALERALWCDFIAWVASEQDCGDSDATLWLCEVAPLAELVLSTSEIDFPRVTA